MVPVVDRPKQPRAWAHEIVSLNTRAERVKHLERVPEHLRDLVAKHVELCYLRRKLARTHRNGYRRGHG